MNLPTGGGGGGGVSFEDFAAQVSGTFNDGDGTTTFGPEGEMSNGDLLASMAAAVVGLLAAPPPTGGAAAPTIASRPGARVTPHPVQTNGNGGFVPTGTDSWRLNRAYAGPLPIYPANGQPVTFTHAGVRVNNVAAGSSIRVGIYGSTAHGEMDVNNLITGVSIPTTASGYTEVAPPAQVTLNPGLYWLATVAQGDNLARVTAAASSAPLLDYGNTGATSDLRSRNGTTSALPTGGAGSWVNANETNGLAHIVWRIAS